MKELPNSVRLMGAILGMVMFPEISIVSSDMEQKIAHVKYQVSDAKKAVVIKTCNTFGDGDRYRYIWGEVTNRTGDQVSNIVVRYQVIEGR